MARAASKRDPAPSGRPVVGWSDRVVRAGLGLLHFVCPLFFFTNLTRNPYYTQIVLLNVGIAFCGILWAADALRRGRWRLPAFPFDGPLVAFLAVALLSSLVSFVGHPLVRPGLAFEMTRVWLFTSVNCVMALFLPGLYTSPAGENPRDLNIWSDIVMCLVWGAMWFAFHDMKSTDPGVLMWDTYGGFVWAIGAAYAIIRTRDGDALSYFHLILAVSLLSAGYGIMEYWGRDIIWSSPVQPYGGRPVSTFGNPNFLSSYLAMTCPLAVAFALRAGRARRWGYAVIALVSGMGVLVTLTRSSYAGVLAGLLITGAVLYKPEDRRLLKYPLIAVGIFFGLIVLFPSTPVTSAQSPLARFTEVFDAIQTGKSYGSWHQRLLIWSAAWDMLKGHFLLGRGWGTFELFFPFFQGKFVLVPSLAQWRTHANNAHNILLELWSQTGFFGVGAALWLFVTMVTGGWLVVRRSAPGWGKVAAGGLLGGLVGMVADNFFGNVSIFFAVPAFLFWWTAGALFVEARPPSFRSGPLSPLVGRPLLVLFIAFCGFAAAYHVLRWNQEVWYFEGFKQAKVGNTEGSVAPLEKAMRWFPGDVNTNYELGNSLGRRARELQQRGLTEEARRADEKAAQAYEAAIRANPGYDEIYFNLGVTETQLGRIDEAVRLIELSRFINPLLKEVYGSLGTLYLRLERYERAAEIYGLGAATFPEDKDLWNNKGYSLTKLGKNDEAFNAYKQAVMVDPSFDRGWGNLAAAARATGRKDPILDVPPLIAAMDKHLQAKDFAGALVNARRIVEILPNSPDAHLSVGNLLFYLNQPSDAEKEMLRALELKPTFAPAHANLGRLYALRGDTAKAREHLSRAVELDPTDAESRRALDQLH